MIPSLSAGRALVARGVALMSSHAGPGIVSPRGAAASGLIGLGRDPVSLLYCFSTSGTASGAEVAGPSRLGLTARLAMNPARQNALLQDSEDQPDPTSEPSPPRVVVFGGNGYIGTHVCQAALALGLDVTAIGRSGRPQYSTGPWGDQVNWVAADALEPESYKHELDGACGVVCSIGGFGSTEAMLKVNGDTNMKALEAAAEAGVPRAAFISAHKFPFPIANLLNGYVQGKLNAEGVLQSLFPETGVILRPGFVYGTRMVGGTALPLGVIGQPLEKVLEHLPTTALAGLPLAGAAFVPPVSVEKLARIAALAVTDSSMPPGVLDPWQLQKFDD